jgi:tetratricopeptide (TPR) repeat protein
VQLARQALELDSACIDAHTILAEKSITHEDALAHYARGLSAAEQTLDSTFFTDYAGRSWETWPARPYMRCLLGLAQRLAAAGRANEAIAHYQELLRFNPTDNQSVRQLLMPELLVAGRDVEAAQLLKQFNERTASWAYAQALLAYRLSGQSPAANRELRDAISVNPHVLDLLINDEPIRPIICYTRGSFEEACFVAKQLRPAFEGTDGALGWVAAALQRREKDKEKRQREQRRKKRATEKRRRR